MNSKSDNSEKNARVVEYKTNIEEVESYSKGPVFLVSILVSTLIGFGAYSIIPLLTLDFTVSIVASLMIASSIAFMFGLSVMKKIAKKNNQIFVEAQRS